MEQSDPSPDYAGIKSASCHTIASVKSFAGGCGTKGGWLKRWSPLLYARLGERALGELWRQRPKNKGAEDNPGGQGVKIVQSQNSTAQIPPTLEQLGLDKKRAARQTIAQGIQSPTSEGHPPLTSDV